MLGSASVAPADLFIANCMYLNRAEKSELTIAD
jgi:hypothetical protein